MRREGCDGVGQAARRVADVWDRATAKQKSHWLTSGMEFSFSVSGKYRSYRRANHWLTSGMEFSFSVAGPRIAGASLRGRRRRCGEGSATMHHKNGTVPDSAAERRHRISIAVLMEPFRCGAKRRLEEGQGDDPCTTPRMNNEQLRKKGAHRVALKQLWKELPISERNEIGQLLAQMMTRKILPPKPEEGSNEWPQGNLVRRRKRRNAQRRDGFRIREAPAETAKLII